MQRSRGACADTAGESTESTTSANRSAMLPRIGLRTLPLRMFARVPGTQSQAAPAVGIVGHARATSRASSLSSVLHLAKPTSRHELLGATVRRRMAAIARIATTATARRAVLCNTMSRSLILALSRAPCLSV